MFEAAAMHSDYQRVAAAIEYLSTRHQEQPGLGELSAELGLSRAHLQRVFSRWAGISPKRFLQYLTKEHAKAVLAESSVLDASLSVGLSGPGRLHDLMVSTEAMTPGEVKSKGAGLRIEYGVHDSPFGRCLLASTERGVCKLAFFDRENERDALLDELHAHWANASISEDGAKTRSLRDRIFGADLGSGEPLHVLLRGTNFQIKVWEALLTVPRGSLVDYGTLAEQLHSRQAARAVGTAVAQNDIAFLIPCHRVIRNTGVFGRYRWGEARKKALVAWESAQISL
jgi:AraC family transcriptional regulator of adaptative response/methylated-DNA-[protein]-cysteine methyltransferase